MMTRHEFLRTILMTGLGATALAACGSDGTGDPDPTPDAGQTPIDGGGNPNNPDAPPATCSAPTAVIGTNHGHTMTVAPADLDSTADKTYQIQGSSAHPHTVVITVAQFATLKSTGMLMVTSSTDAGHPHTVRVTC